MQPAHTDRGRAPPESDEARDVGAAPGLFHNRTKAPILPDGAAAAKIAFLNRQIEKHYAAFRRSGSRLERHRAIEALRARDELLRTRCEPASPCIVASATRDARGRRVVHLRRGSWARCCLVDELAAGIAEARRIEEVGT